MSNASVRTTCPYCGVGCGVLAQRHASGSVEIEGDPEHPANFGRLCSKGSALGETLSLDDRLLYPLIHGERASWDAALDLVATRFSRSIAEYGPDSVAFYVSGQLLTEDYYVANKLMKGFIGSSNIDSNSRLCMASSVAGHKRAFGSDTVPGTYEDIELADLVVLVGSNLAWCHPVLYQRLAAAKERHGTKVVVIDPRKTATCEIADLHLAIAPGSDVALFNGLLAYLASVDAFDHAYISRHANGLKPALAAASALSAAEIAGIADLDPAQIAAFYRLFAETHRVVTVYSQGVNQSTAGTDKVNAIINCHIATGRIGRPGMGPFSVTGQPNAMGGRETGGLANMLAAHMEIDNTEHRRIVRSFWESPRLAEKPGLKAVDLFSAVGDGRIKALWIMATNPVDSLPEADVVRAAIDGCPFVVVSDVVRHTDTTALAHVLLPSAAWGEKSGTVTNSERRISRQRAFLDTPGEARPDWWQLAEIGRRMGWRDAFDYNNPAAIFAEYARMTGVENGGTRDLDISACGDITEAEYERLVPFQWPHLSGATEAIASERRFFAEGNFFTPDRRARFVATPYRRPAALTSPEFPLILNTGRIRDQWHTMTRTAKAARLTSHIAEPFVEVHPADAERLGLKSAHLATVTSAHGSVVVRTFITERQKPGTVFVPIHWTDQLASSARIDALVGSNVDPVSGQPELKHTPVRIVPFPAAWYGFAISTERPSLRATDYWALACTKAGWRMEIAGLIPPGDWTDLVRSLMAEPDADGAVEILAYHDRANGQHRFAAFNGSRLAAALFIAPTPVTAARSYLADQLSVMFDDAGARYRLLAGRTPNNRRDPGPIICACFEVGRNEILDAVVSGRCVNAEAVGAATGAGTNCGSCRTDIGGLIHAARVAKAG
jgi:assimilatory nitrate reductase catalytic subunit